MLSPMLTRLQVFGNSNNTANFEGKQYPYFENEENRIAYRAGDTDWWWLRSPYLADSHGFCYVDYGGHANDGWATDSLGVRPAFCL